MEQKSPSHMNPRYQQLPSSSPGYRRVQPAHPQGLWAGRWPTDLVGSRPVSGTVPQVGGQVLSTGAVSGARPAVIKATLAPCSATSPCPAALPFTLMRLCANISSLGCFSSSATFTDDRQAAHVTHVPKPLSFVANACLYAEIWTSSPAGPGAVPPRPGRPAVGRGRLPGASRRPEGPGSSLPLA